MRQKPDKLKIGIFGTKQDQSYLERVGRLKLADYIELIYFSDPKYEKDTDISLIENSLKNISQRHVAIFFLNKRYGHRLPPELQICSDFSCDWPFDFSITHAEYRKAKEENIPVIVFVNRKAKEEWKKVDANSYKEIQQRWQALTNPYVLDPELYCFIKEAEQGINGQYQSWVDTFTTEDTMEVQSSLKGKIFENLKSLTPTILKRLAIAKSRSLQNEQREGPTITYKFLKLNECLIERKVRKSSDNEIVSKPCETIMNYENNIMIKGGTHAGKTFFLITLFLKHVESYVNGDNDVIPIFFSFKDKTEEIKTLKEIVSAEIRNENRLVYPDFPLNFNSEDSDSPSTNPPRLTLYIDGVEEAGYIDTGNLKDFFKNLLFHGNVKLIISLRQGYYQRNYSIFGNIFKGSILILDLVNLDGSEGRKLVKNILEALSCKRDSIISLQKISEPQLHKPMHCAMLACLLKQKEPRADLTEAELYDAYLTYMTEHEANQSKNIEPDKLFKVWEETAKIYAINRTKGKTIDCKQLQKVLIDKKEWEPLAWKKTRGTLVECGLNSGRVRFKYDQYLNSLLSKMIMEFLEGEREEEVLIIDPYKDTQSFISNRFSQIEYQRLKEFQKKLYQTANEHILSQEKDDDIRIAANCIYLLGQIARDDSEQAHSKKLISSLKELTEKGDFLNIAALFALTVLGYKQSEEELYDKLQEEEIRKRNTDFHLIYYRVVLPQSPFPPDISVPKGGMDCSRLLDGRFRTLIQEEKKNRIRIDVTIICDALEIYHYKYSENDTKKWLDKLEDKLHSIQLKSDYQKKILRGAKKEVSDCRDKLDLYC